MAVCFISLIYLQLCNKKKFKLRFAEHFRVKLSYEKKFCPDLRLIFADLVPFTIRLTRL